MNGKSWMKGQVWTVCQEHLIETEGWSEAGRVIPLCDLACDTAERFPLLPRSTWGSARLARMELRTEIRHSSREVCIEQGRWGKSWMTLTYLGFPGDPETRVSTQVLFWPSQVTPRRRWVFRGMQGRKVHLQASYHCGHVEHKPVGRWSRGCTLKLSHRRTKGAEVVTHHSQPKGH